MDWLNKLLTNMPVVKNVNGSKSIIGILSLITWYIHTYQPGMESFWMSVLGWLAAVGIPVGVVHKAIK